MSAAIASYAQYVDTANSIYAKRAGDPDLKPVTTLEIHSCLGEFVERVAEGHEVYHALSLACAYESRPAGIEASIGIRLCYGPFAPLVVWFDHNNMHLMPAPLDLMTARTVEIWQGLVSTGDLCPLLQARLADLLSVCRPSDSCHWSRIAYDAYLAVSEDSAIHTHERCFASTRCVALKHDAQARFLNAQ
ncbi:hypothetical protein [Candidatus Poriferisodalis sp.]|uniref:hypothetical protein n=1 Tax=Candidatus Poriferisodalis sp. TaxID=3101277 RepID=UPI003B59C5AF